MARSKNPVSRVDELIDELLEDFTSPEDILGESGLCKQLSKRLIVKWTQDICRVNFRGD